MEKKKRRKSPTQLTMDFLRKRGLACAVVEKWIRAPMLKGGGIRRDCFGGDVLCLTATDTILVQAGVTSDHAAKVRKALSQPEVAAWLESPSRKFHVWTWSKKLIGTQGRWVPRVSVVFKGAQGLESAPFELA